MTKKQGIERIESTEVIFTRHKIKLVIGYWKKLFTEEKIRLLLAEALNEWTYLYHKKIQLNGYLITNYCVYLILKVEKGSFYHILSSFYEVVISKINHHFDLDEDRTLVNSKMLYHKPFEKHHFLDETLIKLLIGEKVTSVYENLNLERLKNRIDHYKYCSAIDYQGGKGPVRVTLFNEDINLYDIVAAVDLKDEYLF